MADGKYITEAERAAKMFRGHEFAPGVTKAEADASPAIKEALKIFDANKDGQLTQTEYDKGMWEAAKKPGGYAKAEAILGQALIESHKISDGSPGGEHGWPAISNSILPEAMDRAIAAAKSNPTKKDGSDLGNRTPPPTSDGKPVVRQTGK